MLRQGAVRIAKPLDKRNIRNKRIGRNSLGDLDRGLPDLLDPLQLVLQMRQKGPALSADVHLCPPQ